MKKRILAIIALVLLFGGTTLAFGYWDSLERTQNDQTVVIGEGTSLTVAAGVHSDNTKILVPSNVAMGPNDVTSYVISYNVKLEKTTAVDLDLTVVASNVKVNGLVYEGLIDVAISTDGTINSSEEAVTVTVTFAREPLNITEYNAVYGQDITFDLTFTASV